MLQLANVQYSSDVAYFDIGIELKNRKLQNTEKAAFKGHAPKVHPPDMDRVTKIACSRDKEVTSAGCKLKNLSRERTDNSKDLSFSLTGHPNECPKPS